MTSRPPRSTRNDTLFPHSTPSPAGRYLQRSDDGQGLATPFVIAGWPRLLTQHTQAPGHPLRGYPNAAAVLAPFTLAPPRDTGVDLLYHVRMRLHPPLHLIMQGRTQPGLQP